MRGTAQCENTPLHMAAEKGNTSVVLLLLERGADKEAKDGVRRTTRLLPST
jgi:ankyrin repeat protein